MGEPWLLDMYLQLAKIRTWCDAYPVDAFGPDLTREELAKAREACEAAGISFGRLHATWARHLLSGVKRIAEGGDGAG